MPCLTCNFCFIAVPQIFSVSPNNGPYTGATQVMISGNALAQNQDDIVSVTIHGSLCGNPRWVSVTQISCQTPFLTPSTSGLIVVTNKSGGTSNSTVVFNYNAAPQISNLQPNNGPTAGGTSVNLTGTNFGNTRFDLVSVNFGQVPATFIQYMSRSVNFT